MSWVNFRELREKLDFREVLRDYGVEVKSGTQVQHHSKCPLPTHEGQRRSTSFSAHLERGIWKCFSCGAQGNILDFACRMEKLDTTRAEDIRKTAIILAERYRIVSEKPKAPKRNKPATPAKMEAVINAPLDFNLKNLVSAPRIAPQGFTRVYRAVSEAEYQQILRTGKFEVGSNAMEGKWFADSVEGATAHGNALEGVGKFRIIEADVPNNAPSLYTHPNMDGRGPARYLGIEDLQGVTPRPVGGSK